MCVSRPQLAAHGLGPDLVRRRLVAAAWQGVGPGAVVLHTGPLGPLERRWCAVLGTGGVLAGRTALAVHGLVGWDVDEVEVAVVRSGPRVGPSWLRLRTTTRWEQRDLTRRAGLPLHTVERAALDGAAWSTAARTAGGLVAAVVQQRLTTAARLLAASDAAPDQRHRAEVRSVLRDVAGGSHAMTEVDLVRLLRRHRLPVPLRQVRRVDARGGARFLDAEWRRADGTRLLLEVDGVGHLDERTWYDDSVRAAEVVRAGETLLRLPARALRAEPGRVAALLRRHLGLAP